VGKSGRTQLLVGLSLLWGAAFAQTATQIQLWHALKPHHQATLEGLVTQFNQNQAAVAVTLTGYSSTQDIEAALDALAKAKPAQRPHLVQLDELDARVSVQQRADIVPLHALLRRHPMAHAQWFLSSQHVYAHDAQGRLVAFPWMAEIPVMFYRPAAFAQAGLAPKPERTWVALQGQLVTLANNGSRDCPLISDQAVSVHLENLAAVNLQRYVSHTPDEPPGFRFDTPYVRHLSLMVSWVRSGLMVHPGFQSLAPDYFAVRRCAVLIANSGHLGRFLQDPGLDVAVSGLPYYPQLTRTPGRPFVSGSALWLVRGHTAAQDKAVAAFLGWLAQPQQAAMWHQQTGFLPLTQAALRQTPASYYSGLEQWGALVQGYAKPPVALNRGIRVNHYPQIRRLFARALDKALRGEMPAVSMLKLAAAEAQKRVRQR